jgi:uncharacterized membrane protein YeaQ/YmgE (transglycosylase-associated protein family)
MGLLSWVIFGALAGWVASIIAGTNRRQGCLTDIIVGVAGAFVGGFISESLFRSSVSFGWDLRSFGVAVLGAVVLLLLFRRRR